MGDFIEEFIPAVQLHPFVIPSFYFPQQKVDKFFSFKFQF